MDPDRRIGRVVKVRSYQALVELLPDTSSYVKSSFGGMYAIGVVNSYVILPIGSERVVAVVTGLDMLEEAEASFRNRQMLVLPSARRTMWVSMVGTISQGGRSQGRRFDFGIRRYPELDNPVWFASEEDLDVIFEKTCRDRERAKRLVSIGTSPLFPDYSVRIDMDRFFGKHAAVLGNTGSGKSCTVVALINAVLSAPDGNGMPHAHFIIFDTNAEYEAAFTRPAGGATEPTFLYNRLVVRNEGDVPSGFWVPHWFMNGRDYAAFFRPGEGAQGPLLHKAIGAARAGGQSKTFRLHAFQTIEDTANAIEAILRDPPTGKAAFYGREKIRTQVNTLIDVLLRWKDEFERLQLGESFSVYLKSLRSIVPVVATDGAIDASIEDRCRTDLGVVRRRLATDREVAVEPLTSPVGIDTPAHFDFAHFVSTVIREEIEREAEHNSNLRNWVGTLLLRLEQARLDPRYRFLFDAPAHPNALAGFLRLIFGVSPLTAAANGGAPPWEASYRTQYADGTPIHQVTILDFSQLASDVLENVTALIGRLILEFMQRCPERGKYPVVLVLEEAHHYIPANTTLERQQRAREVFERIAKEGRKQGLGLLVASQRPSELSRTVMSQCNSFIVHRIQNPDDREYFKSVISEINRDLLDSLPALPQQHALVLGDAITVPLQVRINDVDPKPQSHDPEFFAAWSDPATAVPNFEAVCAKWEGVSGSTSAGSPQRTTAEASDKEATTPGADDSDTEDVPF